MQNLTPAGQNLVANVAQRYNLSQDAVIHMLIAVNNGNGTMAQFNCPELGGSGQWMRGGMTMVGDMFNYGLKATVDNLCNELSNALASIQIFPIIPAGTPGSSQWWPGNLGSPFSSGSQNNIRYAIFPHRLAVERFGQVTVYDTQDHRIGGISQQQGGDTSLTFSSQYGTVSVNSLPIISGSGLGQPVVTNFAAPARSPEPYTPPPQMSGNNPVDSGSGQNHDILGLIEKLAHLRDLGAISEDEFNSKKVDLLSRL